MAFEDNKDTIENVYEKMINNLSPELQDNRQYQYFYNLLETGINYCSFFSSKLVKSIDEEWVAAIEEAIPSLQAVVMRPRKYIEEEREVVNIAMARGISPESIQHLMQHSNMIDRIKDDGTVIPNRIQNVFKEESLNTYENRFVATLILELQKFINKRFNVIFDNSKDERGTFFEMESMIDNYTETIDYKLEIKIREKQTDIDNEEENMGKNRDYKACHKLWNYIHAYDRVGYKIDMVKQEPMITKEFERDIYNSFLWDYFMLRNFLEQTDDLNVDRPKRQKEITVKYIRQVLDEIVRGLDMPDANVRKLIMSELADLQLKRKNEKQSAEAAAARKVGKVLRKKGKKRPEK